MLGLLLGLLPAMSFAQDCPSPCFNGGGIAAGLGYATGIVGLLNGDPASIISGVIDRIIFFLAILCVLVIVIAGFYLILGFGEESARDRAKRILLYTTAGVFVVVFARVIVGFIFYMAGVGNTTIATDIEGVINRVVIFLALACVMVIIVAGLFLLLGLGEESSRDRAKRMIMYAAIGVMMVLWAREIAEFIFYLAGVGSSDLATNIEALLSRVLIFVALALVIVIIIAGLFLLLGLGEESSKDRAKRIILYAAVGVMIILLANHISGFIFYLAGQGGETLSESIEAIIDRILLFLALICVICIIAAGLFLILGLGEESSKDRAKRIILYTIVGILLIGLAKQIADFIFYLIQGGGEGPFRSAITELIRRVLNFLALIAVGVIIIAGFVLVLSLGEEAQKDRAKRIILYCLVGLVVIFFARVIVELTLYFATAT